MSRSRAGLLLFLLILSVPVHSQGSSSDDDSTDTRSSQLFLRLDKQGAATVRLNLGEPPNDWATIRRSLATALHCSEQRFHNPGLSNYTSPGSDRWPEAARKDYLHALADANTRQLAANCDFLMQWNGRGRTGSIDLAPLLNVLRASGFRELGVYIYFPLANHVESSPPSIDSTFRSRALQFLTYRILLDNQRPFTIHLFYGLSRRGLYGGLAVAMAFILFPVLITLWMRRTALVLGQRDRTAAWFSYFRTINWAIKGSMLLWITSGLGARQKLQEWLSLAPVAGWQATLFDVAVMIGPAFLIYVACLSLSYPLHRQLRGTKWTRREFLTQQLVTAGAQAVPLMFFIATIETFATTPSAAASFFVSALLSWVVLRSLQMHVSKSYPHALTTGELRDRVFAIAQKAGVKITQIFILPTGKSQVANAYATGNQTVMFTDYLLQHLTKREVIAVAAHEVAHLQLGHVKRLALALWGALVIPGLLGMFLQSWFDYLRAPVSGPVPAYAMVSWFWNWSQRDFVLILIGLMLFYLLSRRYEFAADARAVELTGDAEAQITGLLKVSRLNLMPIRWGKATGSWLTHPSMVRRAERIGKAATMPQQELQAILDRHQAKTQDGSISSTVDHYSVPEASDPENLLSAAIKQKSHQLRLWTLLAMHVIPPAIVVAFVHTLGAQGNAALLCYLGGTVATPIACIILAARLGLAGRRVQRARLAQRLERQGLRLSENSIAVGLSPGALVRVYGPNYYNWDIGFLAFSGDRLSYVGEQVRFSLSRQEIEGVCLGQGGASWWKFPRVYVRFKQADGRPFVFSLASLEPSSIWNVSRQAAQLFECLQDFRTSFSGRTPSNMPEWSSLTVGEITSRSPRELGNLKTNIQFLIYLFPLAVVVNALLHTDALCYVLGTTVLTRLIESIPHRRFRDRLLPFQAESSGQAAAATGNI
jgi:Zn-dependent protease with chaperone function